MSSSSTPSIKLNLGIRYPTASDSVVAIVAQDTPDNEFLSFLAVGTDDEGLQNTKALQYALFSASAKVTKLWRTSSGFTKDELTDAAKTLVQTTIADVGLLKQYPGLSVGESEEVEASEEMLKPFRDAFQHFEGKSTAAEEVSADTGDEVMRSSWIQFLGKSCCGSDRKGKSVRS